MSTPDTPPIPSLAAWLKALWSQVLFSGASAPSGRCRLLSLLALLILPAVLLYPSLGFRLFEPDEGRYAQIPREMLARGEWIVPYLQGEPYLDKPPLLYWLVMGSYRIFGAHDWAARLVPALAVHVTILLGYFVGRRSLGERAALCGALVLSLAPGFLSVGRLLVLDGLLTLWVTLAMLSAFEALRRDELAWGWWLLAALACGLGILTKGPIALVLFVPPLAAYGWLSGRLCWVTPAAGFTFLGVVLAVILPWFIGICCRLPDFAWEFFWRHNVVRFLSPFDHLEPVWYYLPILLGGLLPASLLLIAFLRFLVTAEPATARRRTSELGFMLLAGGWCVLFFSLSGCKLATYILPAFPFVALALGSFLVQTGWHRARVTHIVAACAVGVIFVGHQFVLPWYAGFRSPFGREAEVTRLAGDRATPVVCYPRSCDSLAFYLGRDDLQTFRGKEGPELLEFLRQHPRTVVVFTHRHSLATMRDALRPTELQMTDETPLFDSARAGLTGWKYLLNKSPLGDGTRDSKEGLCYIAVVHRK
ncbi:dolichol-phosphate mannosyltransferase [Planctomycetaceae bacterium SCGC AG-212-F19]|nr:dolichol-phosphate mannosyltransferase [Planctomycetaceae bacterium SCGC AG-212-F19]